MGISLHHRALARRAASRSLPAGLFLPALAVVVSLGPTAALAAPMSPGVEVWSPPVEGGTGAVVEGFELPSTRFGPGHRGADFAAAPGSPVQAVGDGVVVFAGTVAGAIHVVVAHPGGLRTSYSFLAATRVRKGDKVARGQVIGIAGGTGDNHPPGRVHLGLRIGDRYVDPLGLFRKVLPADVVRLAPVDEKFDLASEERVARNHLASLAGAALRLPGTLAGRGADALAGAASSVGTLATTAKELAAFTADLGLEFPSRAFASIAEAARFSFRMTWEHVRRFPIIAFTKPITGAMADWWDQRDECTSGRAARARPVRGTGHLLMRVAGLGSTSTSSSILELPADQLGYGNGEVFDFSYAGDRPGEPYGTKDTLVDIHDSAKKLGDQLRAMARGNPGREVDLVAHSQGGIVVRTFLEDYYDAGDPAFPPLGRVVTLASPHGGAPIATAGWLIRGSASGRVALDLLDRVAPHVPPADAPSVQQLREGSPLQRSLDQTPLPDQIELRTIGGTDDLVVPSSSSTFKGADSHVVVNPRGPNDHATITADPAATHAVGLALEGRAPPCTGLVAFMRNAVTAKLLTDVEHGVGLLGRLTGEVVDRQTGQTTGRLK